MKKLLSLLIVLLFSTSAVFAQSLSLSNADGPIVNGQIIMVSGDANFVLTVPVFVTNNTASDKDVMVRKVHVNVLPNTIDYFCWIQCYPPDVFQSPSPLTIPAMTTNFTNFTGDYDPMGVYGISKIRYVFFVDQQFNDSTSVEIWFNAGTIGLPSPNGLASTFSDLSPNPATNQVSFQFNLNGSPDNAVFMISDLLGSKILEQHIAAAHGKMVINIADFQPGVYLYAFLQNGRKLKTGKLVVR